MSGSIVSDDRVAQFMSDRLGVAFCPPYVCMGIERDGEIIGGALFNHFEGADCHVSLAGSGWSRRFIQSVGEYVYRTLGYGRMTAITECPKVAEYAARLGGAVEGRLRSHFGPGRDALVIGILRDEWRYGNATANLRG